MTNVCACVLLNWQPWMHNQSSSNWPVYTPKNEYAAPLGSSWVASPDCPKDHSDFTFYYTALADTTQTHPALISTVNAMTLTSFKQALELMCLKLYFFNCGCFIVLFCVTV